MHERANPRLVHVPPACVPIMRSSVRMRASTGKAVIDVTTPQNIRVEPNETPGRGKISYTATEAAAPRAKGTAIPVREMAIDFRQLRRSTERGSSAPTQNINKRRLRRKRIDTGEMYRPAPNGPDIGKEL